MKRGQTHLFMQKQPYYLLACCRLVTNHLPKNWEMGFLGFVKCQFKQDIFFFHFVCQSFSMCFCKEFSRRNHQMSQEFGQKLKKRCILKKPICFSWFKVHKNSISVIGPSLLQMLFFRNVSPKNIEKDNQNMFLHILCTLMTENTKKYT